MEAATDPATPKKRAFWHEGLGEFALSYEAVRTAGSPDGTLLAFLESTHAAAADLAAWDRAALEWERGYRPLARWRGEDTGSF